MKRGDNTPRKFRQAQSREVLALMTVLFLAALVCRARENPPQVPPPKPFGLPPPAMRVLLNGLRVVVVEHHSLPLVTLRLVVEGGAEADPVNLPGTAQLVSALITEGTITRSARQIAGTIDSIGGVVDSGADWDSSYLTLSVLNDQVDLAFDLVAEMTLHPAIAPSEVERKRKQTLSGLEVVHDDPGYLADTALRETLYDGTPYSHPEDGTPDSIRRITAGDLRSFHSLYYRPGASILAVVGDITAGEAFDQAEKYFGKWADAPTPSAASEAAPVAASRRAVVAIDKPDAVQTEIRIANVAPPRDSPDFYALSIANQILGGPASNRLFRALRSRQGLTYGASSDVTSYRQLGGWIAKTFTRTPETLKSVHIALEQMRDLRENRISEGELETAKGYLIGHLALEFETSDGIASQILDLMIHHLPLDYWNQYPDKVRAVTAEQVWEATRRYLDLERNVIVLVGNVSAFRKELKKLGPAQVIPLSDVDFGSPNLMKPAAAAGKP